MTARERLPRPGPVSRRAALFSGGGLVVGAAAASAGWAAADPSAPATAASATAASATASAAPGSAVIPPDDDLMREHGVLKRVLLCYREMIATAQSGGQLSAAHVQDSALIIHDFIEGFHEGLEEGYVFPRLIQAGRLKSTVDTLLVQHARGRVITQFLLTHATPGQLASPGMKTRLATAMRAFDRMYEPHEAREDTVIFPAFRDLLTGTELTDLGRHFADLERQQFHADEFTAMVNRVAGIEQELGIYDLNQFTPVVTQYLPPTA
ncbi:MAG TPA: hemerythrin domain-containing protein [Trebonia sp.]|nr:hemerythrin domain-containing protein [Trebonia sp.]